MWYYQYDVIYHILLRLMVCFCVSNVFLVILKICFFWKSYATCSVFSQMRFYMNCLFDDLHPWYVLWWALLVKILILKISIFEKDLYSQVFLTEWDFVLRSILTNNECSWGRPGLLEKWCVLRCGFFRFLYGSWFW